MRRSALPLVVVACVIVAAVLAWLVVQRIFRAPSDEPAGPAVAETRAIGAFTKIDASGHLDIEIAQGDRHEVVVEAAAGDQRRVATVVEGDTLRITTARRHGWGTLRGSDRVPRIVVRVPAVESIALAGAVKLTAPSLTVPALRIAASGTTSIRIDQLKADSLRLAGSGAVKAELAGQVTEQSISLSGAGLVRAPQLASENAKVSVSGAGSVIVNAQKTLRVSLSGAGSVEYLGNPEVKQSVSGLGRVKRREAAEPGSAHTRLQVAAA